VRKRLVPCCLASALLFFASGCCGRPWSAFPNSVPPDEQLSNTSATHGYDMYVWHCLNGARVVVAQFSAEMSCRAPERETAACGATTQLEARVRASPVGPIRTGREWH
jgi:hypothetical protein